MITFSELSMRAKIECMEQFLNVVVPYADYDGVDNDLEYLVVDIEEISGDQFWFDEDGNWYDEGVAMR